MDIIKVSGTSRTSAVAGAIAGVFASKSMPKYRQLVQLR